LSNVHNQSLYTAYSVYRKYAINSPQIFCNCLDFAGHYNLSINGDVKIFIKGAVMIAIKRKSFAAALPMCTIFALFIHTSMVYSFSKEQQLKLRQIIDTINPNLNYGICFIHPDELEPEFSRHANRLFTPASTTKLFTAVAAWQTFGKDFCLQTNLFTDGHQEANILCGSVYLKAAGDPSFTSEDLKDLIAQLKSQGVDRIKGDVYLDVTQFSDGATEYFAKGYCVDDFGEPWDAPTTSFIIDNNCSQLPDGTVRALNDPHHYVLCAIEKLLHEFGITYSDKIMIAEVPQEHVVLLAQHKSQPLRALIAHMLKTSDNLYANALFKLLGAHETHEPGTWQSGEHALKTFLHDKIGIASDTLNIVDGAGLSRYGLISPNHIIQLLDWVYHQADLYPLFVDCLAISGIDGTLKKRMTQLAGTIKAKTGSMGGISTLAGYICLQNQKPLIFSIMLNGYVKPQNGTNRVVINYKRDVEDALCLQAIEFAKDL
jgi:D-alanyl-D-alanine carboxypeptidase